MADSVDRILDLIDKGLTDVGQQSTHAPLYVGDLRRDPHVDDCDYAVAATCPVAIECEHGRDVCPICDPCTCDSWLAENPEPHLNAPRWPADVSGRAICSPLDVVREIPSIGQPDRATIGRQLYEQGLASAAEVLEWYGIEVRRRWLARLHDRLFRRG